MQEPSKTNQELLEENTLLKKKIQELEKSEVERKQIEEADREEERFHQMFLKHDAIMLLIDEKTGAIRDANHAALRFYGYSRERLCQMTIQEINILPAEEVALQRALAFEEKRNYFIFPHRLASGEIKTVEVHSSPVTTRNERILFSIIHDITYRKQMEEELRGTRALLDTTQQLARIGGWEWIVAQQKMTWTDETYRIHGMTPGDPAAGSPEHIARSLACYDPNDCPIIEGAFRRCTEEGKSYDLEFPLTRTDGRRIWIQTMARPVMEGDLVVKVTGNILDITERKQAEEALRNALHEWSTSFDAMSDGVSIHDVDHTILRVNRSLCQILDRSAEALIGKKCYEVFHGTNHPTATCPIEVTRRTGKGANAEFFERTLNKWLSVSSFPVFNKSGQLMRLVHVVRDITEVKQANEALRESEERYRLLVETANEGIWSMDGDHRTSYVNQAMANMLGYDPTEMLGKKVEDFFFLEDMPFHEQRMKKRHKGEDEVYERRFRRRDGKPLWTVVSAKAMNDSNGEFLGSFAMFTDITKRKQVEKALQESEERFRLAYSTSPDAININRMSDGLYVDINEGFTRLTGFTRDDAIGKTSQEINIWCNHSDRQKLVNGLKEKGYYENLEAEFRRKDGSITTALMSAKIMILQDVPHILSITRDISDRKRAEEEYRTLFREMLDGFALHEILCNEQGKPVDYRFLAVNPSFEKLTGLKAIDIVGSRVLEVLPNTEQSWIERYGKVALTGEPTSFENYSSDLNKHFMVTAFRPAPNQFACIFADITERKTAEEEKLKLQNQLLQSQKMESIGRLAGGVAHDFNNMLGVILGHAEMAMELVDPAQPLRADLEEIIKAAKRSADLTHQLLAFARKQTVSPRVLDLNETMAGMLKILQRLIGEDIHLVWRPVVNLWPVKIDPSQVDQILANLCVNARDAIAGVGKVTVETDNVTFDEAYCADHASFIPGDYVLLAVSDNGCGMDKEILDKLFEPFFTTKEAGKGTGLGLATIYGIIKQNNGFVNVYSELGHGTTFRIYLPRHLGKAEQVCIEKSQESVIRSQETVLVVEDELAILDLSKRMLERQGYQVLTANTPVEAIRLVEDYPGDIDLLMTDVVMPEMNGRDLAKRILSFYPSIKCLFTSGYTANVIAHHGVLDEGVHFLQKPFSLRDLTVKVRAVLDQE
ncbi:MAG: PAS domain S-box protein [Syntrophus sp. (in: bacteria)]